MASQENHERVLVVDEEPEVLQLITKQVLEPLGYVTASAQTTDEAIYESQRFEPDLIIASLTLPGLSGKDLIVALRSRGIEIPVLVTANEGMEEDAIQAFRLGARNFLVKPLREAEVAAAVEHALNENRLRKERQNLADQIAQSNRQLEQRVRELTTLYGIGQAVTSMTSQPDLFSKLVDESVEVTNAELGWIVLIDNASDELVLKAQYGFPPEVAGQLHQVWNDGLSSVVMRSDETLIVLGEDLKPYELAQYAQAAMVAPMRVHAQAAGVIGVARKDANTFNEREEAMLAAVADYASLSLVNVRLFQALAARTKKLENMLDTRRFGFGQQGAWIKGHGERLASIREMLTKISQESESTKTKADLMDISDLLEELIQDVADVSRAAQSRPETSPPKTPI
jgi:two-component system NtrC family sensor kinase